MVVLGLTCSVKCLLHVFCCDDTEDAWNARIEAGGQGAIRRGSGHRVVVGRGTSNNSSNTQNGVVFTRRRHLLCYERQLESTWNPNNLERERREREEKEKRKKKNSFSFRSNCLRHSRLHFRMQTSEVKSGSVRRRRD